MKTTLLFFISFSSYFLTSCKKESVEDALNGSASRPLKIAIVSDIHYLHPSLITNNGAAGTAFQDYLNQDPKLVEYSDAIWRQVMAELKSEKPDILLVPGDITKDGEKLSNEAMAGFLTELRRSGMKVYVIPGNHDINNTKAKRYEGNNDYAVAQTSKEEFASIYSNLGYNDAISKDPNSLSYVVQPHTGLRIVAIDASKYEEYGPSGDVAAGRIKPQTLAWILGQLAQAKQQNVQVYAMMHHNLIEHYKGQSQLDPGYVIDDWENVTHQLMEAGLQIIFTGHYHANDISSYSYNGKTLHDIETGSLVTAPSPYRIITVKDNKLAIESKNVQTIQTTLPGNVSFPTYANTFLSQHLDGYFNYYLSNRLGVPQPVTSFAAPIFRDGIMAHFAGDETMSAEQTKKVGELAAMSQQLAGIVTTLWTDTGVKDNKAEVKYE